MNQNRKLFQTAKRLNLDSRMLMEGLSTGNYRSIFRGTGIEFNEVREYVEEDDARLIDWNVSGRMNNPYTKTFREERELALYLITDVSSSVFPAGADTGKKAALCQIFALFCFAAVRNSDRVGALFFTDRIERLVKPRAGRRHAITLVQNLLAGKKRGEGSNLAFALAAAHEAFKRRGMCVVLSDFRTQEYGKELARLKRRHDIIAIRLESFADREFPVSGLVPLADWEEKESAFFPGSLKSVRRAYAKHREAETRQWFTQCRRLGVDAVSLDTASDPVDQLIDFFGRRKPR